MGRESKAERKFKLLTRLQAMGFSYDEAQQLRRIEKTLHKWAEDECNGDIQRDERDNRPFRVHGYNAGLVWRETRVAIADREAGALKRLKAIVDARNTRAATDHTAPYVPVHAYHQTDPRGCTLHLVKASDLPNSTDDEMRRHSGEWPLKSEATRLQWKLSVYYSRGLAVCE